MLKDAGGPLVLIMDGDTRDISPNAAKPIVTVDNETTMEAMAMGNESWYAQLGTLVPQMFAQLKDLDAGLKQISGRSFVHAKTVGTETNNYINVLSLFIPEGGTALDAGKDHYKFAGKFVIANDSSDIANDSSDITTDTSDMEDSKFRGVTDILAQFGQGTMVFKSGSAYAFLWKDTAGNYVIVSYDMLMARIQAFAATGYKDPTALVFDTTNEKYLEDLQALAADWMTKSSDTITIWTQAQPGVARSPYLGLVVGGYDKVASQPAVSDK